MDTAPTIGAVLLDTAVPRQRLIEQAQHLVQKA